MRILAIDYGNKHTGLAICDQTEKIASPLAVLQTRPDVIRKILGYIENEHVGAVVVGLPLNMNGSEGPQAKQVRQFANELKKHIDLPLHFQDERLSSFEADEKLSKTGLTRKKKRKRLDAIAAAGILQSFLDSKQSG